LLAVLLIWALVSEDLIVHGMLWDRTLLFYATLLTAIVGLGRSLVPSQNLVFQPELYLSQLRAHLHYSPAAWRKAHSHLAFAHFSHLYEYAILSFIKELLGVLIAPFLLLLVLPQSAEDIVRFFQEFTVDVPGIGPSCSLANFDATALHASSKNGSAADGPKRLRSVHGKLEKSIITFQANNPEWNPTGDATQVFFNISTASSSVNMDQDALLQSMHIMKKPLPADKPLSSSLKLCGTDNSVVLHQMQAAFAAGHSSKSSVGSRSMEPSTSVELETIRSQM